MQRTPCRDTLAVNVADAKKRFSELLGRVAFGGATVLVMRRGRPLARIVRAREADAAHLGDIEGWLDRDDPFFAELGANLAARSRHRSRLLKTRR